MGVASCSCGLFLGLFAVAMEEADDIQRFYEFLEEVSKQEELRLVTPVNRQTLQQIEELKGSPEKTIIVELFAAIEREIVGIINKGGTLRSIELLKKRSIPRFHSFRTYKLPVILEKFPSLPRSPFLWQCLSEKIFLAFFKPPPQTGPKQQQRHLDNIEKNAVRYAAGYVLRKLRKKYSKDSSEVSAKMVDCIGKLIHDPTDLDNPESMVLDDFEAYTKVWLTKTDRGGLLHVTDETFWFFCEVEIVIYDELLKCFKGEEHSVADLTATATKDSDIQFIWSIISSMEDADEQAAQHLLTSIVDQWIVLRGHSLRNRFMENYKVLCAQTKAMKRSLRKELQRSESTSKEENQ